jgi:hypothetical protein
MIILSRDENLKPVTEQTGRHICLAGAQTMKEKKSVHGKAKLLKQERWYKFTSGYCAVECYAEINRQPATRHCSVSLPPDRSKRYQTACWALRRFIVCYRYIHLEMYARCEMSG